MKRKYTSKTYMKGVSDWDLVIQKRESENYYLTIKRINKIDETYFMNRTGQNVVYLDNGYFVVEFTPLNHFYNARAYLDRNANVVGYYFDMTHCNGVEENIPYYDDLYLDIIYCPNKGNQIIVDDEDELLEALNSKQITQKDFELAKDVCSELIEEIQKNKNIFVNMDKKGLIQKYFK